MKFVMTNLTTKMVVVMTSLHLVLSAVLYIGLGQEVEKNYQSQFVDYVRSDAYHFATSIGNVGSLVHEININAIEDSALTGRTLYTYVLDNKNNIAISSGIITNIDLFKEDFSFGGGANEDGIYHISERLHDIHGQDLGEVRFGYDESITVEEINRAYSRVFWFALIYGLIAITGTVFFGRRLTTPIQRLQDLTKKIADGEFNKKILVNTGIHELKRLSETIEFMRKELVSKSESMEYQARHDFLTGLPNRFSLEDLVNEFISTPNKKSSGCTLAIIDLDRFKEVNDSLGHHAGDDILQQAASRIKAVLRKSDTVARIGGDEYAFF